MRRCSSDVSLLADVNHVEGVYKAVWAMRQKSDGDDRISLVIFARHGYQQVHLLEALHDDAKVNAVMTGQHYLSCVRLLSNIWLKQLAALLR